MDGVNPGVGPLAALAKACAGRSGDVLAVLAGAALVLAFAPVGFTPLAVISPAILFYCWQGLSPRRALLRGWLYGLGLFGVGASWVFVSFYSYGDAPLPVAGLLTLLFVAFLALFPALLGFGYRRLLPGPAGLGALLFLPAGWVLLEWVRGWLFSGFPWLNLGYSQIDTVLAAYGPVVGVYGMSYLVVLSSVLLFLLLMSAWRNKPFLLVLGLAVWTVALVIPSGWTQPVKTLRVRLVQGDIPQERKWLPEELRPTLELYSRLTLEQEQPADIVVWPETAIPAFYHWLSASFLPSLQRAMQDNGMELLTGIAVRDREAGGDYNSIISLGKTSGTYNKRHLVPFGEYLPFKPLLKYFGNIIQVPMDDFSAGAPRQKPLLAAGVPIGASICYEAVFGEELIRDLPTAQLLVNVSNDAWFGRSLAPHQQLQITRMRALETGRYLLRATNTGITAIIDDHGRVTGRLPSFETGVLNGIAEARSGATPYVRFGNTPVLVLLVVMLAAALAFQRLHNIDKK